SSSFSSNQGNGLSITECLTSQLSRVTCSGNQQNGLYVAAGDVNGDGYMDFCTCCNNGWTGADCRQKLWTCSNFRFELNGRGGLHMDCPQGGSVEYGISDGNTSAGIDLVGGMFRVHDNACSSNTQGGIQISGGSGSAVYHNVVLKNALGISISSSGNTVY